MKRKICSLFLLALMLCVPARSASAADFFELMGETGQDGHIDIFLYSSEETKNTTNAVYLFNMDEGITYWVRFNNYNYPSTRRIWTQRVNLPNGRYAVSGGVYMDVRAKYAAYTEEDTITVDGEYGGLLVLVGTPAWLEANRFSLDELTPTPDPTPFLATPTPEPTPRPTFAPAATPTPEPVPGEILTEEPSPKLKHVLLLSVLGAVFVLWLINAISKRR